MNMLRPPFFRSRCTTFPLLTIALLLGTTSAVESSAVALKQVLVFEQGESGYDTFRIPAIVKAANGDLLAMAEGRVNSTSDTGDIDLVMKRSTDGGSTWGPLQVVQEDGVNTVGNPVPILDSNTGDLVLLTTRNLGHDTSSEIIGGTSDGTRTVWVQRSTDDGATWSTPVEITEDVKARSWRWYATGPGGGIQLRYGEHAGRLVAASVHNSGPGNGPGGGAHVIYSDDGGLTWRRGALMVNDSTTAYLPSESQAVELVGETINVNSRNRGNGRASSLLGDAGLTFLSGVKVDELVDPTVEGSIQRFTWQADGHDQNRILFANPAHPDDRREMTVRLSYDETATWTNGKLVRRGPSGYSDMALISDPAAPNPVAGLLYENGVNDYRDFITLAIFDQQWLESPDLMRVGFIGQNPGAIIESGASVLDTHGNGQNATLLGGGATVVEGSGVYGIGNSGALRFDGVDDRLQVPDTSNHLFDFEGDESFTLEAVFATTHHSTGGSGGSGPLLAKDVGPGQPSYWLRIQDGNLRFFVGDDSQTAVASSGNVTDGQWHHVAAVFDAVDNELRLYLDDQLVDTQATASWGSLANGNDLLVGAFNDGLKFFQGDLEFARISAGALEPAQFLQPLWTGVLGDINQDGVLSGDGTGPAATDDISALLAGWGSTDLPAAMDPLASYMQGDLNLDGSTNFADAILMRTYLIQNGMSARALANLPSLTVPEPAGLGPLAVGVAIAAVVTRRAIRF